MKLVGLRAVGLLGCVALLSSAAVSGEEADPVVLETAEAVAGTEAITGGENVAPEGEEAPVMEPGLVGEQNAEIEANTKSSAGKSGAKKALLLSVFLTLIAAAGAVDYFVTGVTPLKKMIEGMLGSEAAEDLSEAGQTKEEETEEKAEQAGEEVCPRNTHTATVFPHSSGEVQTAVGRCYGCQFWGLSELRFTNVCVRSWSV